jgi:hypothetical protein
VLEYGPFSINASKKMNEFLTPVSEYTLTFPPLNCGNIWTDICNLGNEIHRLACAFSSHVKAAGTS